MIISKLQGGLGNQLFQYAFGRALADRLQCELYLDLTTLESRPSHPGFTRRKYELGVFPVRAQIAGRPLLKSIAAYPENRAERFKKKILQLTGLTRYVFERALAYDQELDRNIKDNTFLSGYWQSDQYFIEDEPKIRADLGLKFENNSKMGETAAGIKEKNAVSVHIRRGDYVGNATHYNCGVQYYEEAISSMGKKLDNPVFYFFSDDMGWVRRNLVIGYQCSYIEPDLFNCVNDLVLMSSCKHHIIANSTFSWWGAWLNNSPAKKVIAPKRWFNHMAGEVPGLLPGSWTRI